MSDSSFEEELVCSEGEEEELPQFEKVPKDSMYKLKFKNLNDKTYAKLNYKLKAEKDLPYKVILKGNEILSKLFYFR